MWSYEKKLEYPVKITQTNPQLAQVIITQYGGLYVTNIYNYHTLSNTILTAISILLLRGNPSLLFASNAALLLSGPQ